MFLIIVREKQTNVRWDHHQARKNFLCQNDVCFSFICHIRDQHKILHLVDALLNVFDKKHFHLFLGGTPGRKNESRIYELSNRTKCSENHPDEPQIEKNRYNFGRKNSLIRPPPFRKNYVFTLMNAEFLFFSSFLTLCPF